MKRELIAVLLLACSLAAQQMSPAPQTTAQVVVLGTGTPRPDPDRSGPSVAVVVNGKAYLVDFGPGVVRRAAAAQRNGIEALDPRKITVAFCTHLHSDHTAGLSDLYLTPAVIRRVGPLQLYGPPGLADMARHIQEAYAKDYDVRIHGLEHGAPLGYEMQVHEIKPGVVYRDENVTVTAFAVHHGTWDYAYGYRFDTPGRSIVISGDTSPTDAVVKACHGCDVLLHEVYSTTELANDRPGDPTWPKYLAQFHTSTEELGRIASKAQPKLLVLYHQLYGKTDDQGIVSEVKKGYSGEVVSAKDLGVY
ncbi:MAG: MBL fold metallo-hydrolase [Mycobacteriales bacterium]